MFEVKERERRGLGVVEQGNKVEKGIVLLETMREGAQGTRGGYILCPEQGGGGTRNEEGIIS
jgi:hypothetical protein